ncbi:hypothetical protein D3C87_89340 [compost metagenome]
MSESLSKDQVKRLWIQAQKLDTSAPFGKGVKATQAAVEHLGYVQIDTISVIERCHHHILFNRIPEYRRQDLHKSQSQEKTVFEYWTHALAYVPTRDFRFFMRKMARNKVSPPSWFSTVKKEEMGKVLRLIKQNGPISIREIADDVLVDKNHPWASRKPSKKALQLGFHTGRLVISERQGMLKKYELQERHFDWDPKPKAATGKEVLEYLLERTLRSQGVVSLDSICYLSPSTKPAIKKVIEQEVKKGKLIQVAIKGLEKIPHWMRPELLEQDLHQEHDLIHILSPFDPLVIQRKRLQALFDYEHRFEAYIPKEKRVFGYFALPVLIDDQIVAAIDLKTDRENKKLLMQKWNWIGKGKSLANKKKIEAELHRFEKFQLNIENSGK